MEGKRSIGSLFAFRPAQWTRLDQRRPRRCSLLSFERPASVRRRSRVGRAPSRVHLENSIAVTSEFFTIKRLRAHGGCLGAKSRRRTWAAAISPGEVLTNL